ncbi:MAG: tetratricopeptide repeat protein [Kiritimatiellae bacterium]|nr:tetratricopeptide repeat protein [Kiritimatiellia bacterium]
MAGGWQSFRNRLYVLLFGAAIAVLAWAWGYDSVPPDLMEDLAVAAGLRPPTGTTSLLWQYVAAPLCRNFGVSGAEAVLRVAGHVSLGVLAVLVVALFEMLVPASLRRGEHVVWWWRAWVRFVLFQGAAVFCCSDPVWRTFRWFSPASLQALLVVLAVMFVIQYFKGGRRSRLFAAFAVMGLLTADTPIGALMVAGFVVLLYVRGRLYGTWTAVPQQEENPLANALLLWRLTLSFMAGMVAGEALEISAFAALDGLAAFGWTWGDYALKFPVNYLKELMAACSPAGMFIFFAVAVCPVLTEFGFIKRATDDETHLEYLDGVLFLFCGLIAFSQLSGARQLWFWTWAGVHSDVLKCVAVFLCSLAVMWALSVFTIELYLRNFRRILTLRFQDAAESAGAEKAFASMNRLQRIIRIVFLFLPVLILGCVVPFRAQRLERTMLGVVADAAREVADECRDVECVFTDGGLDAAVELAAAEKGRRLIALSMKGRPDVAREIYLRTRGVTNAEDKVLLESGAPDALRTWVRTRPDKAKEYAVQLGFVELWQRHGRPMPDFSGLVARPKGFSTEDMERGAEAARSLSRRILEICKGGDPDKVTDRSLRDAFFFVLWRLAVLARHRANAYDARGERDLAVEETRLADELDRRNAPYDNIRATMARARKRILERMTAREGLEMRIRQRDFARAHYYAKKVLEVSSDDPSANWAIGMDFYMQGQYARAQVYLERCLKTRPNEPSVLNNLAQCRLRLGDPDGALPYAERALEVLPDAPEVKGTMKRIKAALEKKAGSSQAR